MFESRVDAGQQLAKALAAYRAAPHTIVLGIPRGGVVVAAEVARALELPLDIVLAAKVGAPGNPEYAIGAMAEDGALSFGADAGFDRSELDAQSAAAAAKIAHGAALFRQDRPTLDLEGATAVLVDDGLATGLTARAAADWLHRAGAAKVIVAVPVASREAVRQMRLHAEEVVVVETPASFTAVGQFYERFEQTTDAEVREALSAYRG